MPPVQRFDPDPQFMQQAIDLATTNVTSGHGGPFGAVIVRDGELLATGVNRVTATNDPTAHAEVTAIRNACAKIGHFQLTGAVIYTSCEPCPMCLSAIHWARLAAIFFGNTAADAARAGFDDSLLYDEVGRAHHERATPIYRLLPHEALASFEAWQHSPLKVHY